jgi:hypothetical protein
LLAPIRIRGKESEPLQTMQIAIQGRADRADSRRVLLVARHLGIPLALILVATLTAQV